MINKSTKRHGISYISAIMGMGGVIKYDNIIINVFKYYDVKTDHLCMKVYLSILTKIYY